MAHNAPKHGYICVWICVCVYPQIRNFMIRLSQLWFCAVTTFIHFFHFFHFFRRRRKMPCVELAMSKSSSGLFFADDNLLACWWINFHHPQSVCAFRNSIACGRHWLWLVIASSISPLWAACFANLSAVANHTDRIANVAVDEYERVDNYVTCRTR